MPPPVATFTGGTLRIDQPSDGAVFNLGETIVFQGQGTDPESGSLTFDDLAWESHVDGALGTGPTVARNDLWAGMHTVTLTGTFSEGRTASRSVSITVGVGGVPQVGITSPVEGTTVRRGEPIEFSGTASDPEDGEPTVLWTSDIDGDIGSGTEFTRSNLSEGDHTITMEATDSDGNVARATTRITVLTGIPEVGIASPEDGAVFDEGSLISFVGSAVDPEDGVISSDGSLVWESSIEGEICTGTGCVRALAIGTHTITLTATDSDGNTGAAEITVTVNPRLADLRFGGVTLPGDGLTVGESFAGTVEVENAGTEEAPEGWEVAVHLSADATFGEGDVQVATSTGPALSSGASGIVTVQGEVPAGLEPGDYWWIVRLDPADEVVEADESDNQAVSEEPVEVRAEPLVTVNPVSFEDDHFLGLSPCPDPLGTLAVTNPRDVPVTVTLAWSRVNEIALSSDEVTIPPGGTAEIGVEFTCSTTTSFTGTLALDAVSEEGTHTVEVPVTVRVLHRGVVLAQETGPFEAGTFITLDRISGASVIGPEQGCSEEHLHGSILIDGEGPYPDPDPSGCGHGVVTYGEP